MISKRTYRGEKFFLIDLEQAFNVLKNRTARVEEDRDGSTCCYVEGWSDTDAAAVWLLVNSGVKGNMFNERLLLGKVKEIEGKPVNPDWVGHTISSSRGISQVMTPSEFAEAAPEDTLALQEGEDMRDFAIGSLPLIQGVTGVAESTQHMYLDDQESLHVPLPPAEEREAIHDHILTLSPEAEVTIRFNNEKWRIIKIVALLKNITPEECVKLILEEGMKQYNNPEMLSRLTEAIFS